MSSMLRVEPFDDRDFDPDQVLGVFLAAGVLDTPYPAIAELRKQSPVQHIDMRRHLGAPPDPLVEDLDKYAIIGYEAVKTVFENPKTLPATCWSTRSAKCSAVSSRRWTRRITPSTGRSS